MAATRYGVIIHADFCKNFLRFENAKERDAFQAEFDAYHASHDHDGDPPIFENAIAAEYSKSAYSRPVEEVTIDGYPAHNILDYHEAREHTFTSVHYQPPTCCVPPLIALDNQLENLIPADTFHRHDLSAAMLDMPDDQFLALIESIATKGIMDNIIKVYEGQILDGWHRYRACQELGILRKLRFQVWKDTADGDVLDYVIAQNLHRRQLTPGQTAQILLGLADRYGHGGDRRKGSQRDLETFEQIAERGGVSVSTIKRASAVQKLGDDAVEAVKAGEISATKVLADDKKRKEASEKACKNTLRETLKLTGKLETSTYNASDLAKLHGLTKARVDKLKDEVFDAEILKARDRWNKSYTKARRAWFDNQALQKSVDWDDIITAAIEQVDMAFLSKETFTEADSRIKDCTNYQLLSQEADCLLTLAAHIRNPSFWVSALISKETAVYPDWQINKAIAAERDMLSVFRETGLNAYMELDDLSEEITNVYGFPDFSCAGADGEDPLVWIGRFTIIINALKNKAGWVQDLHKSFAECKADETDTDAEYPLQDALDEMKARSLEDAKQEHLTAQSAIQSAFFDTKLHEKMQGVPETEKLPTFHKILVEVHTLRYNFFSEDFYYDTRGDSKYHEDVGEELQDIYRGRDLKLDEIQHEIQQIHAIAKDICYYMSGDEILIDWMDTAIEMFTTEDEADDIPEEVSLSDQIKAALSEWKSQRKGQGVQYASKAMCIEATIRFHNLPRGTKADDALLAKTLRLLTVENCSAFDRYIMQICDGESIWSDTEDTETLNIALQKWKEKRNHLPELADATVDMVVDATKRYDDLSANDTIDDERVVLLLGSDVAVFQLYVQKLLQGVDIFKIPNDVSLEEIEAITPPTEAKAHGHGTQGEFNTSDNAPNPTDDKEQIDRLFSEIETKVNGKTVAELLGENCKMWAISIEWKRKDVHGFEDFENVTFLQNPTDPRNRPLSMLPERLIAELLQIAMPAQAENATLGWEAGYTAEERQSFSDAYTAWTQRHKSELSELSVEITGQHVCKAFQCAVHNLKTNVITPTDYHGTALAMEQDDERLLKGLRELYGEAKS